MRISGKHRASQDVNISALHIEMDLKMVIDFTVFPGCKETLTEPGEPASAEIDDITFFTNVKGTKPIKIELPDWLVEDVTNNDEFRAWLLDEAAESTQAALEDKADADRNDRP